jgi:hypothetical protein
LVGLAILLAQRFEFSQLRWLGPGTGGCRWGRLVLRCTMASCCRKARFSTASSRCDVRLDLAVASRAYSTRSIGVGSLDPERGNVSDFAVDGGSEEAQAVFASSSVCE